VQNRNTVIAWCSPVLRFIFPPIEEQASLIASKVLIEGARFGASFMIELVWVA